MTQTIQVDTVKKRSSFARLWLFGLAALIVIADRISKNWVASHIELGNTVTVIPGVFRISHVMNSGAAFSLFEFSKRPALVRESLIGFSVLAAIVIVVFLLKMGRRVTGTTVALAMILGGAIGNVYDRIQYGMVIDFLEVHIIVGSWNYHWPDFNIADSAIVIGGILLFLDALLTSGRSST